MRARTITPIGIQGNGSKKDADKVKRSDAFAEKIMKRDDLTEKEKMRLIRQVTENINTENEVEFRNGGKVSLGNFKGSF